MADPVIRVRVGLDHDPDDPALVYTDLADRVHYGAGGGAVEVTIGRQDEQAEIKPTEMAFAVRNGDGRFTPGNPDSDLYGKWEQGRRVQIAEVLTGDSEARNRNPFFTTNTDGWSVVGGTFTRSTAQAHEGAASGLLVPNGVTANVQVRHELVPVEPGEDYTAAAWVRVNQSRNFNLQLQWFTAGGGFISSGSQTVFVRADEWTRLEVTRTAPATAAKAWMQFDLFGTPPATLQMWIDEAATMLADLEFVLGTGFLEIPEMPIVDARSTQPVTVTAIDRMGRLESAPTYIGTLAEYIRTTDAGPLVEYYPLTDPSHPMVSLITGRQATIGIGQFFADGEDQNGPDLLQPASAEGPPGDDGRYPVWSPTTDPTGLFNTYPRLFLPVDAVAGAGQVVAVSAWVLKADTPQRPNTFSQGTVFWFADTAGSTFLDDVVITDEVNRPTENSMEVSSPVGSLSASRGLETSAWRLITLRIDRAFSRLDLWVGADLAASQVGLPLGAGTIVEVVAGDYFAGSIGHVQVRIGDPLTTMTRAHHLAQHQHGYMGLHRQTVAERLATLAGWAGVPASQVAVPVAASTPMQVARVAGRSPAEAMRATAATGQDTLITDADGRITVVPRSQRYGQPVAMQIPFGWIERRGIGVKPDRPVTDVTVSRTGGGTTKRSDRARAARYGVTGQPYELDTAVDADPANLADWALAAYAKPRTRTPRLRIDMLARTRQERKALLGLKVGDRIELVELPAGSPEDLPDLIVQGIKHTIGPGRRRRIEFNTSPMLGPAPGVPPVGARVGSAVVGNATLIGY